MFVLYIFFHDLHEKICYLYYYYYYYYYYSVLCIYHFRELTSVQTLPPLHCKSSPAVVVQGSPGYISSYVARKSGCGNVDHPWKIEVLPGQRVNVTLLSFGKDSQSGRSKKCQSIGYAKPLYRLRYSMCTLF